MARARNLSGDRRLVVAHVVNVSGTPKESLLKRLGDVYDALERAAALLKKAAPNGRDYYPEPGSYTNAIAQHERRLMAIRDLQAEIETEMDHIA